MVEALFETLLSRAVAPLPPRSLRSGECQTAAGRKCTLCLARKITYEPEYNARDLALHEFWDAREYNLPLDPLVASPFGRNYRTVSKRRVVFTKGGCELGLVDPSGEGWEAKPLSISQCVIEPQKHADIYLLARTFLQQRENSGIARMFNHIIVKGNYDTCAVIFNIRTYTAGERPYINRLSKFLTERAKGISGIFVFVDEKGSGYYLSRQRKKPFHKIYGKSDIVQVIEGKKLFYSPLSFSQTNHSILARFVEISRELLDGRPYETLYDLYCGYGLFALNYANSFHHVVGAELEADSVRSANDNARRLKIGNCRFVSLDINPETLRRVIGSEGDSSKVILDPPRGGTKPGVIEFIAAKRVKRVVHIFCNVERMSKEIERWRSNGYHITRAIPFDMFPGTKEVEIMVTLEP